MQGVITGLILLHVDIFDFFFSFKRVCNPDVHNDLGSLYLLQLTLMESAFTVVSSNHTQLCVGFTISIRYCSIFMLGKHRVQLTCESADPKWFLCGSKHEGLHSLTPIDVFCNLFPPLNSFSTFPKFQYLIYVCFLFGGAINPTVIFLFHLELFFRASCPDFSYSYSVK